MVTKTAVLAAALVAVAAPSAATPWELARSEVLAVAAPDGHPYRVMVAWPEGEPPKAGWPVLWVLDGEDNFALAAQTARRLARGRGAGAVNPGLVVAIDSGPLSRRVLDYTPSVPGYAISAGLPAHGLPGGGAASFLSLIEKEVRPRIAARWQIDTARETLAGHSFGGLIALHDLTHDAGFDAYAAVSPSLWYGDGKALDPARRARSTAQVLIAAGSNEGGPAAAAAPSGPDFAARLRAAGLRADFQSLPGQSHGTTMIVAMPAIVRLAFGAGDER